VKEIVIISGKGGTGKTSLTGSLVQCAQNVVIGDCDVDAADLHLLLAPQLRKEEPFISGHEAIVDSERCIACGRCEQFCRFDAIEQIEDGTFAVKEISCEGCGVCVEFCPVKAIDFPASNCGDWFISSTNWGDMVHARLKAGAENSGKLVSLVRSEAKRLVAENGGDWIVLDGPPGIGCPVISSVTGVDIAVIVTEPTLSGKHDLQRVLKLAKQFGVTPAIVINKSDLNSGITEEIEQLAEIESVKVVGKIPYSSLFTEAQSAGKTVVEFAPESREVQEIKSIWNELSSLAVKS
jgi:MinD superfamily P-loop ATPase